jgi:putative autoinducer-2 (AI-2) aldolase
MARDAINQGASGVDMGRNIFQSDAPIAMIAAVRKVVHDNVSVKEAYEYYQDMKKK